MSRIFRRENQHSEQSRQTMPATPARAAGQQRGWQANEPNGDLRSVWGAHRTAKVVLFVAFVVACVGFAVYAFVFMLG